MVLKARYAMTEGHCHFQLGPGDAVMPPAGPGQALVGVHGENPLEVPNTFLFYSTINS